MPIELLNFIVFSLFLVAKEFWLQYGDRYTTLWTTSRSSCVQQLYLEVSNRSYIFVKVTQSLIKDICTHLLFEYGVVLFVYFFRNWWNMIWRSKPMIAAYCLLLITFLIASLIVLSLIPLYLPKKQLDGIDILGGMFIFLFFRLYLYWIIDLQTRLPSILLTELI